MDVFEEKGLRVFGPAKNAAILESRGAAVVLQEADCTPQALFDAITALLADEQKRKNMSISLRNMVILDSAEQICDRIQALSRR